MIEELLEETEPPLTCICNGYRTALKTFMSDDEEICLARFECPYKSQINPRVCTYEDSKEYQFRR